MPRKRDWETVTAAAPSTSGPDGPVGAPRGGDGKRRSNLIESEDPSFTRTARRGSDGEPGSLFDVYGRGGGR